MWVIHTTVSTNSTLEPASFKSVWIWVLGQQQQQQRELWIRQGWCIGIAPTFGNIWFHCFGYFNTAEGELIKILLLFPFFFCFTLNYQVHKKKRRCMIFFSSFFCFHTYSRHCAISAPSKRIVSVVDTCAALCWKNIERKTQTGRWTEPWFLCTITPLSDIQFVFGVKLLTPLVVSVYFHSLQTELYVVTPHETGQSIYSSLINWLVWFRMNQCHYGESASTADMSSIQ